jgi:hypothetical protein
MSVDGLDANFLRRGDFAQRTQPYGCGDPREHVGNVAGGVVRHRQCGLTAKGAEDRAGGVVWRARDANNYYVVRANALEDNVVLYKTVDGKRSSLDIVGRKGGYDVKTTVPANQWHTLHVESAGTRSLMVFNGKPAFEVEDTTLPEARMVGVWTKADSVTSSSGFVYGRK